MLRNPGIPLDLGWPYPDIERFREVLRKLNSHQFSPKGEMFALVKSVTCLDLTSLNSTDSEDSIRQLCALGRDPIRTEPPENPGELHVAAICVYHVWVPTALDALRGSNIPVAAVSAGFPHGLSPMRARLVEIEESIAVGATEIDVVINRGKALAEDWKGLYDEVKSMRDACGEACMKVILGSGELPLATVWTASLVAMMAGADFIKTSTGKEEVNATLEAGLVMAMAIRDYHTVTGFQVGLKPAGGIKAAADVFPWVKILLSILGDDWLVPSRFRIGASSLLTDICLELQRRAEPA